jgi:acylpyruvate hydrolase
MAGFAKFRYRGRDAVGTVVDDRIAMHSCTDDVVALALQTAGDTCCATVRLKTGDVHLLPPLAETSRIIGVGANFYDALQPGSTPPTYPVLFPKFVSTMVGPYDPIELPPESSAVDYEGELALVVGRTARRISETSAAHHIAGVTIANDVSARDFQQLSNQWMQGKVWDKTTPLGPWIVPFTTLPSNARIRTRIDGATVQHGALDSMIFSPCRLVSIISTFMTLHPGDIILTGTPAGAGQQREPQSFLAPGQTVEVSIDGIGALRNRTVRAAALHETSNTYSSSHN